MTTIPMRIFHIPASRIAAGFRSMGSLSPVAIAMVGIVLSMLTSCKTTERNMYQAYEQAVAVRDSMQAEDDATIFTSVRRQMNHTTLVYGDESYDISVQWVRVTPDGGGIAENLKKYCVVVGQFRLPFNALSMRERIADNGYPSAFVVETRAGSYTQEQQFFVLAGSFSDIAPAIELLRKVRTDSLFVFKSPLPFILQPSQIK